MIPTLVYDYNPDGTERPVWLVIHIDDQIDLSKKKRLYADVTRCQKEFIGTFSDDNVGCTVHLEHLLTGHKQNEIGIDLPSLRQYYGFDFCHTEQLIMLASDVAEVLSCNATL